MSNVFENTMKEISSVTTKEMFIYIPVAEKRHVVRGISSATKRFSCEVDPRLFADAVSLTENSEKGQKMLNHIQRPLDRTRVESIKQEMRGGKIPSGSVHMVVCAKNSSQICKKEFYGVTISFLRIPNPACFSSAKEYIAAVNRMGLEIYIIDGQHRFNAAVEVLNENNMVKELTMTFVIYLNMTKKEMTEEFQLLNKAKAIETYTARFFRYILDQMEPNERLAYELMMALDDAKKIPDTPLRGLTSVNNKKALYSEQNFCDGMVVGYAFFKRMMDSGISQTELASLAAKYFKAMENVFNFAYADKKHNPGHKAGALRYTAGMFAPLAEIVVSNNIESDKQIQAFMGLIKALNEKVNTPAWNQQLSDPEKALASKIYESKSKTSMGQGSFKALDGKERRADIFDVAFVGGGASISTLLVHDIVKLSSPSVKNQFVSMMRKEIN